MTELVGIPYAEADCREIARRAFARLGQQFPPFEGELSAWADRWQPCEAKIGALVHMQYDGEDHLGVIVEPGIVLHAREATGSIRSRLDVLRRFVCGFYELKEAGA